MNINELKELVTLFNRFEQDNLANICSYVCAKNGYTYFADKYAGINEITEDSIVVLFYTTDEDGDYCSEIEEYRIPFSITTEPEVTIQKAREAYEEKEKQRQLKIKADKEANEIKSKEYRRATYERLKKEFEPE